MNFYTFSFSNKSSTKLLRHFSFWFLWVFIYSLSHALRRIEFLHYPVSKAIWHSVLEVVIQLPLDMLCVYLVIYILIPKYLSNNKFFLFFSLWVLSSVLIAILNFLYMHKVVIPLTTSLEMGITQQPGFLLYIIGTSLNYTVESGLATSIRLLKQKISFQKEAQIFHQDLVREIEEKQIGNVQEKGFLENVIDNIYHHSKKYDKKFSDNILQLKQLSHYIYVETKKDKIKLDTEISGLKIYLQLLSSITDIEYKLEVENSDGISDININPFIMIPVLEPYFSKNINGVKIHIKINQEKELICLYVYILSPEIHLVNKNYNTHKNLYKKLRLRYPQGFSFSKIIENESIILQLQVHPGKLVL
jgi:two-component system, LytTR family, sensor kinase